MGESRRLLFILLAVALWTAFIATRSQDWYQGVTATTSAPNDIGFGFAIVMSPTADFIAIGNPFYSTSLLSNTGSVTVLTRGPNGWIDAVVLTDSAVANAKVGKAVATSGTKLVAGAPDEDNNRGCLYYYSLASGTWSFRLKYTHTDDGSKLGTTLVMDNTMLAAGSPGYNGNVGAIWVFTYNVIGGMAFMTKVQGSGNLQGLSVTMTSSMIVFGAPGTITSPTSTEGYVVIRPRAGATSLGTLPTTSVQSPDGSASGTRFGQSVAILTDYAIAVGTALASGKIFILSKSTAWAITETISSPSIFVNFAYTLSYSAPYLLVGSMSKAVIYSVTGASISSTYKDITPSTGTSAEFGKTAVAIVGTYAAVSNYASSAATQQVLDFSFFLPTESFTKSQSKSKSRSRSQSQSHSNSQSNSGSQSQSQSPATALVHPAIKSKSHVLGYQVAIHNGIAAIAAPFCFDTSASCDGGYILLYGINANTGAWNYLRKVNNPFQNRDNKFGSTIVVNDKYLIVSAPDSRYINQDVGVIALFEWSNDRRAPVQGPTKDSIIRIRKTDKDYDFGSAIANIEATTVVGMPEYDATTDVKNAGCSHVYKKKDDGKWGKRKTITAPTPAADERFGQSVSMVSETKFAVSNNPASTSTAAAAVYIYELDNDEWKLIQTLPNGGKAGFGWKIRFFDGLLYVSVVDDATPGADKAGSITVYEANANGQYTSVYAFQPTTSVANQRFGFSFSTDGARFVVGTKPCDDGVACNIKGAVFTFTKDSSNHWAQQFEYKLGASDGSDNFGYDVAVEGNTVLASAPFDKTNARKGKVYFIKK